MLMGALLLLCAGKKRRRHIQQPKPVQKYDLNIAAFEFSSTQKMHDDEPVQSEPFSHKQWRSD